MSINSALLSGVSGLVANSAALATISDNIANVNTVGYKTVDTEFSDIVTNSATLGDYDAGGVLASTRQLVTQQGNLHPDRLQHRPGDLRPGLLRHHHQVRPDRSPTPASSPAPAPSSSDSSGDLENAAGLYLQGWPVNADGTVTTDPSSLELAADHQRRRCGRRGLAHHPAVAVNANLNASQTISDAAAAAGGTPTGAGAYDASTSNMAAYDADNRGGHQAGLHHQRCQSPTARAASAACSSTC